MSDSRQAILERLTAGLDSQQSRFQASAAGSCCGPSKVLQRLPP